MLRVRLLVDYPLALVARDRDELAVALPVDPPAVAAAVRGRVLLLQRHMHHFHASVVVGPAAVVVAQQQHLDAQDRRDYEREGAHEEGELGQDHDRLEEQRQEDRFGRDQTHDERVQDFRELLLALRLELDVAVEFLATYKETQIGEWVKKVWHMRREESGPPVMARFEF